jgi:hypothetical protein
MERYCFWVDLILIVPCVAVVVLVWYPFLAVMLRHWIHLPLLPFRKGTQTALRSLGPVPYVLIGGILLWGWPCFAGIALSDYLNRRYWEAQHLGGLPTHGLLWSFLIWSATGVGYGLTMWKLQAPRDDDKMIARR